MQYLRLTGNGCLSVYLLKVATLPTNPLPIYTSSISSVHRAAKFSDLKQAT